MDFRFSGRLDISFKTISRDQRPHATSTCEKNLNTYFLLSKYAKLLYISSLLNKKEDFRKVKVYKLPLLKTWNAKNVETDFFRIQSTSLRSGEK